MLPPNTQHFETNLPITFKGLSFNVQIQAGIRPESGQVFATFRSIDPNTDLPPPADIGFLPPDDGMGLGQGHIAFLVRPKAGLPSGTEIRNIALVDFANGEVIATDQVAEHDPSQGVDPHKQALVTIDAGAPTTSITALPAQSGPSFVVQWSGHDDIGGSGIASYDIFTSTNGGSFGPWLLATTNASASFIGVWERLTRFIASREITQEIPRVPLHPPIRALPWRLLEPWNYPPRWLNYRLAKVR